MDNLTELFINILHQADSVDVAESEFKKLIGEDDELHKQYRSDRDQAWDSLSDFDE